MGEKSENSRSKKEKEELAFYKMQPWIKGVVHTRVGEVKQISTKLSIIDMFSSWKVRWGIGRMNYRVEPGIYSIGNPNGNSPVLVTANYKLSFDKVRCELSGRDAWLLVLDTKGVNVWCAAGKGTFGTEELVNRILKTKLPDLVSHKTLIVPQLGAPGVSSHEVFLKSGFKVVYGPVAASDLNEFLNNKMVATPEMRKIKFNAIDRLVLTPIELVTLIKPTLIIISAFVMLNKIFSNFFSRTLLNLQDLYGFMGALIIGCIIVPVFLPWIPVRSFSLKGWLTGVMWVCCLTLINKSSYNIFRFWGHILVLPSISAFISINFTGSSTYTSFSGVLKELKIAIPSIIASISIGMILIFVAAFK